MRRRTNLSSTILCLDKGVHYTGGLGFIGSHTVIELIKHNHEVIITDNLINSKIKVLDKLHQIAGIKPTFYQIDVTDEAKLEPIFSNHQIDGVIHFAGLKAVGGLYRNPLSIITTISSLQ
nr:SDR family NAD(P)-dependent oxidoreductase [Geosporobacter ferrireducens]